MATPFERLLGDTAELRVLDFLLSLERMGFTLTELSEYTGYSRKVVTRVARKFHGYGILKHTKDKQGVIGYRINPKSPFVKCIAAFNECLIETMIPKTELKAVREYWEKRKVE